MHDVEERIEAAKQRLLEWKAGDFVVRYPVSQGDIAKAEAIQRVFRCCLVGEKQVRDFKILFELAKGKSVRRVAKQFKVSHPRVIDRRNLQIAAIWKRVEPLMRDQPTTKAA